MNLFLYAKQLGAFFALGSLITSFVVMARIDINFERYAWRVACSQTCERRIAHNDAELITMQLVTDLQRPLPSS